MEALLCTCGPEPEGGVPVPPVPPPPPPTPPPPQPCFLCEYAEIYDVSDAPPRADAVPGTRRCAAHAGRCSSCPEGRVMRDERDLCDACGDRQPLCHVCCAVHIHYNHGDALHAPATPGGLRCFLHLGHCASCLKYSVESETDLVCAKCARDGYRPAYGPKDLNMRELLRDKFYCTHAAATPCYAPGRIDVCTCGCSCYWCNSLYGWVGYRRQLPPPPTKQEEEREAALQYFLSLTCEERWQILSGAASKLATPL